MEQVVWQLLDFKPVDFILPNQVERYKLEDDAAKDDQPQMIEDAADVQPQAADTPDIVQPQIADNWSEVQPQPVIDGWLMVAKLTLPAEKRIGPTDKNQNSLDEKNVSNRLQHWQTLIFLKIMIANRITQIALSLNLNEEEDGLKKYTTIRSIIKL